MRLDWFRRRSTTSSVGGGAGGVERDGGAGGAEGGAAATTAPWRQSSGVPPPPSRPYPAPALEFYGAAGPATDGAAEGDDDAALAAARPELDEAPVVARFHWRRGRVESEPWGRWGDYR